MPVWFRNTVHRFGISAAEHEKNHGTIVDHVKQAAPDASIFLYVIHRPEDKKS